MAIAVSNLETTSSTSDSTTFTTGSVAPAASSIVLVAVSGARLSSAVAQSPSTISGAGMTFVKITESLFHNVIQAHGVSLWWALGANPTSGALTITFANSHSSCCWSIVQLTGTKLTNSGLDAIGQFASVTSGGSNVTSLNVSLGSTPASTSASVMGIASSAGSVFNSNGSHSLIARDTEATAASSIGTFYEIGDDGLLGASWTGGAQAGAVVVEIIADAVAYVGQADGTSTVTGASQALIAGVGSSTGTSTATATSTSTVAAVGNAAGTCTVTAVGETDPVGYAAGTSTVDGFAESTAAAVGNADGTSTATATGSQHSVGVAAGTCTVTGFAVALSDSVGNAAGTSTATAQSNLVFEGEGFCFSQAFVIGFSGTTLSPTRFTKHWLPRVRRAIPHKERTKSRSTRS